MALQSTSYLNQKPGNHPWHLFFLHPYIQFIDEFCPFFFLIHPRSFPFSPFTLSTLNGSPLSLLPLTLSVLIGLPVSSYLPSIHSPHSSRKAQSPSSSKTQWLPMSFTIKSNPLSMTEVWEAPNWPKCLKPDSLWPYSTCFLSYNHVAFL